METLSVADTGLATRKSAGRAAGQPNTRRVAVVGGDVVVEVAGKGPPLVLVHGWAVDRRMWAHQLTAFRRRFTTISYDRRGCGQSSAPADFALEAQDLDAILDELKLTEVSVVGMSQGGRVALTYAMNRRARVNSLVLQGAPLDDREAPAGDASVLPLARYARLLKQGERSALLRELMAHSLMDAGEKFPQVQAELATMLSEYRGEDLLDGKPSAAATQPVLSRYLAGVQSPTLVITGSEEPLWLANSSDRICRHIRAAKRRVIRGGGHFANMTHASDYNTCVLDFLLSAIRPWRG